MAIILAFWLLLGSLFPKTDMEELCKVPILIKHYISEHANLSFLTYLQLHYNDSKTHTDDNKEHEQLPLQTHSNLCVNFVFTYFKFSYFLNNQVFMPIYTPKIFGFLENHYDFQLENSLFSPPKSTNYNA